jgi:uncharacterized protein
MKVIIDTNVIVSGIFFKGIPFQVLDAWRKDNFQLIVSHEILNEYQQVASRLSEIHKEIDIHGFLDLIAVKAEMCFSLALPMQVTADPKDEKFISCAIASTCKIIVSGDTHLLDADGYNGIQIIKPRKFIEEIIQNPL